jgi:tRNA dimethylallyltransferase
MLDNGLIEETEDLLKNGYAPHLKSMTAIGYRHIIQYLKGEWSLKKATEILKRDTRRYAKRQMTWFKAESDMIRIDPEDTALAGEKIRGFMTESP